MMVHVFPLSPDVPDVGRHSLLNPKEVGTYLTLRSPLLLDCALCRLGICTPRYIFDTDCDDPLLIHGTYGSA